MNNSLIKKYPILLVVLALISVSIWGFNFTISKIALTNFPPFLALSIRFFIAFIILFPFYPKPPIPIKQIVIVSLFFGLGHLGFMYFALYIGISASIGVVVTQIGVPFTILLAFLFFKEKPNALKYIGMILAIIGTILLAQTPNSIDNKLAFFLIILSGFCWGLYCIWLKKINSKSALALVTWISFFSFFITIILSIIFEDNHLQILKDTSFKHWLALLYTAIFASIIAHGIWGYLITNYIINKIIFLMLLVPIFGVFSGVLILNEPLTQIMVIGSILMILGVKITLIKYKKYNIAAELE